MNLGGPILDRYDAARIINCDVSNGKNYYYPPVFIKAKTIAAIDYINYKFTVINVVVNQCSHDTNHDLLDRNHDPHHLSM
jgi:hypothetical protein